MVLALAQEGMLNAIIGWEYTRSMSSTSAWKRLAIHVIDFKGLFARVSPR